MDTQKYRARFNEQIWVGLVISLSGAALLVFGYSGLVGEWWATEGHDKITVVIVAMGVGLLTLGYLKERAERIGTERARRQLNAAMVAAGVVAVVFLLGGAVLAALMLAFMFALFVPPWLRETRAKGGWSGIDGGYFKGEPVGAAGMVSRLQIDRLASRIDAVAASLTLPEELEKLGPIVLTFDNTWSPTAARQHEIMKLLAGRGEPVEYRVTLVFY